MRPPREERTKHETKPRRNRGKHAFLKDRVFVRLIAFVSSIVVVFFVGHKANYPRDLIETLAKHNKTR